LEGSQSFCPKEVTDKMKPESILAQISSPHQLRRLSYDKLGELAEEIRERIIDTVSRYGGHLASNLGVVDLTIALHYVFDFSRDKLLWDVGHQCYPHKLLTGRTERFNSLRQSGGLSGFPSPAESPYDLFYSGHAGTAISTAAGLAWAQSADESVTDSKVVAVVGDAGIVNGLSFEAINNAALLKRQFLIILNDNSMAIDKTRGALAKALDRIRMDRRYSGLKQSAESMLQRIPLGEEISEAIKSLKQGVKTTLHGGKIFEALGIAYFGPIDGHDIPGLVRVLTGLSEIDVPVILHVRTQKGRGCRYAVEDPCRFHSPAAYLHQGDKAVMKPNKKPTWTKVFSESLVSLAQDDKRIVAITAAMPDGTGLVEFRQKFPDRYVDVGISESHAVAMAAGLAKSGLRPIVAVYSTFMQRAFDQVFQEVALQGLPVLLCMDRAGLVGSDGAVHHGFADIAYLRPLPGMVLMAPADALELKAAMAFGLSLEGPAAIRYPRDEAVLELPGPCPDFRLGRARTLRKGTDANILAYGAMVETAIAAATVLEKQDQIGVGVVNARFAKPLDGELICELLENRSPLFVCEDHAVQGGLGSSVLELAASRGMDSSMVKLVGIPDKFISHSSRLEQMMNCGMDVASIAGAVKRTVNHARKSQRYA